MRLVDIDEIFKELRTRNISFNADVNEVLTTATIINIDNEIEKVKRELIEILEGYKNDR